MTRSAFTLQADEAPGGAAILVAVAGEIDVTNAADFSRTVSEVAGARPVVLQLSDISYLDSAGFAALDGLLAQHPVTIVISSESRIHKAAVLMQLPFAHDVQSALHPREAQTTD